MDELDRDHEASEQAEMSASRRKIQLQETVKVEEIDEEKWTKLKGRSIVSACRFIQGDVNIMEMDLVHRGLYDAKMYCKQEPDETLNCFCELLINSRVSRRV